MQENGSYRPLNEAKSALYEIVKTIGLKLEDVGNLYVMSAKEHLPPEKARRIVETVQKAFPVGGE